MSPEQNSAPYPAGPRKAPILHGALRRSVFAALLVPTLSHVVRASADAFSVPAGALDAPFVVPDSAAPDTASAVVPDALDGIGHALSTIGDTLDAGVRLANDAWHRWPVPSAIAAGMALLFGGTLYRRRSERTASARGMRRVLDALPDAVALFDAGDRLTAFNERLVRLLPMEHAADALLGTSRRELYARLSPDARTVERAREDARAVAIDPDATLGFELPSYTRCSLLVKERTGAGGGTAISVYGTPHHDTARLSDPLTALPNRMRLVRELALRCSNAKSTLALIIVDLRSFRQINDTYGRASGDELLRQTARCLRRGMPRDALIARIGGDEFAVLLELDGRPGVASGGRALIERRVAALLSVLRRGLNVETMNVPVRASVGIAYAPEHGNTVASLMRSADSACAHAKRLGNNTLVVFNSTRQQEAKRRHQLEVGLQQAIERGELSLQYQPQVDIRSKMTCGMEALLRWHHPEFGRVSPVDFIPIAEHTGIITRVGGWVLKQAIEDYQRLARYGMSPAALSVNLSRKQFDDGRIVREIGRALERSGFDPAKLILEITETALFSDSRRLRDMLRSLTALGARLSIDDFGVGYSSLFELKDFPVGEVKIDRAFVSDVPTDENSQDIIRAIVSVADSIGAEVVAEGIENQAQFDMVSALGCDRAQGYWLCEPMSATTFPDVVLSV